MNDHSLVVYSQPFLGQWSIFRSNEDESGESLGAHLDQLLGVVDTWLPSL
jgi:hypothetical protein